MQDGRLTIKALRTRTSETNGLAEFAYGSFSRTVPLPAGADEDDIAATYDRGILTVSVPLVDEPAEKHVEVYEIAPLDEDEYDEDDIDGDNDFDDEQVEDEGASVDQPQGEDQPQHDQGA